MSTLSDYIDRLLSSETFINSIGFSNYFQIKKKASRLILVHSIQALGKGIIYRTKRKSEMTKKNIGGKKTKRTPNGTTPASNISWVETLGLVLCAWCSLGPASSPKALAFVPNQVPVLKTHLPTTLSPQFTPSPKMQRFGTLDVMLEATLSDDQSSSSTSTFEPFLKGVKRDFGDRLPQYKSDIVDGLNAQSLATIFFLFFACLAPAVGFGSVLGALTGGEMGVIEMVASTSLSGVLYAALSAQPVQLIGPQGPVVAFVAALYALASSLGIPFLGLYAATGSVASVCLALMAVSSASNLVQKLSRWTDEIFSVLVSVLFLAQAFGDVGATFAVPSSPTSTTLTKAMVTALMTLATTASTFGIALTLKSLPKTRYLTQSIRKNLSNFAPAIGVLVGSLVARAARLRWGDVAVLPALQLPHQFVTSTGREWSLLSSLVANTSSKLWLAAIPAGIAASILLYLDQNITARLVNHPRFQQTKGKRTSITDGMHGDLLVLAGLTALSSILGLPWMCGAPTRSAAHVRALAITDETTGETKGTIENRVSGFSIHALIGLCAVATLPRSLLATVPKAALSGVFLYLGFTSLQGLELWDRFRGLFKDTIVNEKFKALKRSTITVFTVAQMACVWTMKKVTQSKYGVVSPLLIALLPLARWGLIKSGAVTKQDMKALDD
jgi:hypothetical protein